MHHDTDSLRKQIAARREAKRRLFVRRVLFVVSMTLLALALLVFWLPQAPGADLTFSFHRQPDEEKHTPWYLCVENLSPEPARVRLADIYRAAAGNVALYDPGKLANVMRHKPRAKWLRALGIAGAAASIVIPLAGVKEIGVNLIGPALSGGTAIAVPAIEANQQFEVGIEGYWTTDHMLDTREARCARAMSARSKDTLATFTFESRDVDEKSPVVSSSFEETMNTCSQCGEPHDRWRDQAHTRPASYCHDCHAAHMRAHRPKHSELPDEARRKANARSYANTYQDRGLLIPKPCARCGDPDTEKHHEDYSKPLDVEWLCRDCHLGLHRTESTVEPPVHSGLKVNHGGAYTLPGDCVSCQTDTAMSALPCRPSAVVEEDGVEPCAWVD